jgi:SpoVK/Ycf46/Vps4 family AAA+-type ATPase
MHYRGHVHGFSELSLSSFAP